jgi:ABC-type branched-subunit amino acid transport system ATPase component
MTATLACSGLRKSFGDRVAVDGVGFSIAAGETYGLLGPNGAGKTTTISIVSGLLTRDAGEVVLEGQPFDTTSIRSSNGRPSAVAATHWAAPAGRCARMTADGSTAMTSRSGGS